MESLYKTFSDLLVRSCKRSFIELKDKVCSRLKRIGEPEKRDVEIGFVDGSNTFDERRGVGVFLFSACGLIVDGRSLRMREFFCTSNAPIPHILFPKYMVQTRGNTLMSVLELMVALAMVRSGTADYVFMDGSYVSSILAPAGALRSLYRDIRNRLERRQVQAFIDVVNTFLGRVVSEKFSEILEHSDPKKSFVAFLESSKDVSLELYVRLRDVCGGSTGDVWIDLLNYSSMCVEENFFLYVLKRLLEEARNSGCVVAWFAKDSDSRFITRDSEALKWMTDEAFLDEAWRDLSNVYVKISDITSLSTIRHGRAAVRDASEKGDCIFQYDLAEEFYENWGTYDGIYVKFYNGPVFQVTLPAQFSQKIDEIPSLLLPMCESRIGCPRPIIYVHFKALMRESVARIFADELWFKTPKDEWLMRVMLSRSGRRRIGI